MVNNKVILIGRFTKDAVIIEPKEKEQSKIARFTLAVDKAKKRAETTENTKNQETSAHFIRCTAFDNWAEFCEKYGKQGVKFALEGHLASGSYEKGEQKIYTMDVVVENMQFCEKKNTNNGTGEIDKAFEALPKDVEEGLPFK